MSFEFLVSDNVEPKHFSEMTGVSTDTLRDWRKRGIGTDLCRPHPNRDGRWIYSRKGAAAVLLAKVLVERGLDWKRATIRAKYIVDAYLARRFQFDGYADVHSITIFKDERYEGEQPIWGETAPNIVTEQRCSDGEATTYNIDRMINLIPGQVGEWVKG